MSVTERIAVVDLGTNSTRMLVADGNADGSLAEVDRHSRVTRLGQGVDAGGRLAGDAVERVFDCLDVYRRRAHELGANRSVAVATSAVRDAANGAEFAREVRHRFGFDIRVIGGEEEARLTFLGATSQREPDGPVLVIDIGGGSTEFVVGEPGGPPAFHASTQMGSVRQSERHLHADPPSGAELAEVRAAVRETVTDEVPGDVRAAVEAGIAVAGTATSLAAIAQRLDPYDPARVHGYELRLARCEQMLSELAALPLERRRDVTGLHPDRAPTIVAGAAILVESMRAFGLDRIEASEADILHGAALDALDAG